MSEKTVRVSGGIGLGGALFVLFVALQLTGHIDWEWYWIAAPMWIPLGVLLAFLALFGVGVGVACGVAALIDWRGARRRRKARAKRAEGN